MRCVRAQLGDDPVVVVGGGIGGLSCALALAAVGIRSIVLEQAPAFAEVGAGIQVGPNMVHALSMLGLKERVLADAWRPGNLIMRDALDGTEVTRVPLGEDLEELFGEPYAVTHRADLLDAIREGAEREPLIDLRTSAKVESFRDRNYGVDAVLEGGETVGGTLLVGADGLFSSVREQVVGDGAPRRSGHIAYRAVLRREDVPDELWSPDMVLWAGPKTHFVHYPLRQGALYNLVAVFHSDRYTESWNEDGDPEELWRRFEGERPEVWELLRRIETWKYWVLCDREPQRPWSRGRVALLGDAAHPTLQYLAQGAAMALEDALCIASELAATPADVGSALRRYEDGRVIRTARVQLMSRFYGDIYHAGGVTAELRKELLEGRTPERARTGMAWLYGYKQPLTGTVAAT
jgi:salicylate hydroxylase